MREQFDWSNPKLTLATEQLIAWANDVIEDIVRGQGYILTLRQLYYQLVTKILIVNNKKSYRRLGTAIGKGRMLGLIDWDAIEDRGRVPTLWPSFINIEDRLEQAVKDFSLDWWDGQSRYVEVWTEKDALSQIVHGAASEYAAPVVVCRGYSSLSAMRDGAQRFKDMLSEGRECVLLYLGDHDPSGLDMVRDVTDRFDNFEAGEVEIRHLALTQAQVQLYNPPPNYTKPTDSRAPTYVAEHGYESWEVDALTPGVLTELISGEIIQLIDWGRWEDVRRDEAEQRVKGENAVREALL